MFKKIVAIFSIMLLVFSFSGCQGGESAETAATNFLNAIKTLDTKTIAKYSGEDGDMLTAELSEDEDNPEIAIVRQIFENMTFEIKSAEENGDTATVKAAITNTDMNVVFTEVMNQAFSLIFSGASEEEMDGKIMEFMTAAMENNKDKVVTEELDMALTKEEDGWKVDVTDELLDAIMGGWDDAVSGEGDE